MDIENDLESIKGFQVDLVNENDEIIMEDTNGSSVKIVKLVGDNFRVTEV